jgi:LAO/AO transport system kinase
MKKKHIENWIKKKKEHRGAITPEQIFDGIRSGDAGALGSGITLIESMNAEHREDANDLVKLCLAHRGDSIRVGITGVPGVGKSTFIESFGHVLTKHGKKVAVLTVDPSSSISGGSILADKTRMQGLSVRDDVFIRPSPAGDTLGGVARKTRESIVLCEAAGYDIVLVETVGVGQSETVVKSMVDFFLLLMLSGAGDELQGIKKGIMEMADGLLITKADGDNVKKADLASAEYKNALHLFPSNRNGWTPQVFTCSAIENRNIDRVYDMLLEFYTNVLKNGSLEESRKEQDKMWLAESLKELISNDFFSNAGMLEQLKVTEDRVFKGELTSFQAAEYLYKLYNKKGGGV